MLCSVLGKLDLGVFVKEVVRGGPADRSGQVRAGDRIIAINGQSLEGLSNERAVQLIRTSHDVVELFLSQPATPLTSDFHSNASELSGSDSNSVVTLGRASLSQSQRATPQPALEISPSPISMASSKAPFPKPTRSKKQHASTSSEQYVSTSGVNNTGDNEEVVNSSPRQRSDSGDSSDLDIENYIPREALSPLTIAQVCATPEHVTQMTSREQEDVDVIEDESPRAMSPGEVEENTGWIDLVFVFKARNHQSVNLLQTWRTL